jgi:3-methylcrotonyl-CoA carboxylase alpha subunit
VQMRLTAPRDGVIAAVRAETGDLVDEGAELVSYAED